MSQALSNSPDSSHRPEAHRLRLYVAGSSPRSLQAIQAVKRVCETELQGHYDLEVIDIYQEAKRAREDGVMAIPTLIKDAPGMFRRLVGDLSVEAIRCGLELP